MSETAISKIVDVINTLNISYDFGLDSGDAELILHGNDTLEKLTFLNWIQFRIYLNLNIRDDIKLDYNCNIILFTTNILEELTSTGELS